MVSHELTIEQFKTADFHSRHQPRQRHFRRIGYSRKHAFAKKRAAHGKAIKTAHEFALAPTFHAVRQTLGVQRAKRRLYIGVDPRLVTVRRNRRAGVDHLRKCGIGGDAKPVLSYRFCQRL